MSVCRREAQPRQRRDRSHAAKMFFPIKARRPIPMPYRRRPTRRGRGRRRRPAASRYMSTAAKVATMALTAYRGVNYLKGLVNAEKKFFTVNLSATVSDTGAVSPLTEIAQGDTAITRDGNSIFARMLSGTIVLTRSTSGNAVQTIRVCIFQDNQQVADSTPTYTQLFATSSPISSLAYPQMGRFKVLWSRIVHLDQTNNLGSVHKVVLPLKHHIRYNGTASTDIQKGGLYLAYCSDQTTENYPGVAAYLRTSYYDN